MAITRNRAGSRLVPSRRLEPVTGFFGGLACESAVRRIRLTAVYAEEKRTELVLTADLPPFTGKSIDVGRGKSVLTLRGQVAEHTGSGERRRQKREPRLSRVRHSVTLPGTVTADAVTATFENGALYPQLPMTPEPKGRTTPIRRTARGAPRLQDTIGLRGADTPLSGPRVPLPGRFLQTERTIR